MYGQSSFISGCLISWDQESMFFFTRALFAFSQRRAMLATMMATLWWQHQPNDVGSDM